MLLRNSLLTFFFIAIFSPVVSAQDIWEPLNVGTSVQTITTLNGNIFVSSYGSGGGILRSTDGGDNWSPAISGMPSNLVRSVARSGSYLLAGHNSGIYRSSDNGNTWVATSGIPSTTSAGARKFFTFGGVTLAVFGGELMNGGGIYRSTDNGGTWSPAYAGLSTNMTIYHLAYSNGVIYVATSVGVLKSTDNAMSWQTLGPNVDNYTTFSIQFFENTLVAVTSFGVLRSNDLGQNWSTPATGLFSDVIVVPPNPAPTPIRGELIAYDGKLFLSTGHSPGSSRVYRSIDGGVSFTIFDAGMTQIDQSNQNQFYASEEGLFIGSLTDAYRIEGSTVSLVDRPNGPVATFLPTIFSEGFTIDLVNAPSGAVLLLMDVSGRIVRSEMITSDHMWIERDGLKPGSYNCILSDRYERLHQIGRVIAQ